MVSDRGALLLMATTVPVGETLLLTNAATQMEQECRVVSVRCPDGSQVEVAVEFTAETRDFWLAGAGPRAMSPVPLGETDTKAL